jgi:NAD(P)-dependent dehydrogenase (short-subunit alcohol dehydrogenase family)
VTLAGEVAIITGAGRGIGAAIAFELARHGAVVAVTARSRAAAEVVASSIAKSGGRAAAFACDVSDFGSITQAVADVESEFGTPTVLVNNAGRIEPIGKLAEVAPEDWANLIQVNLVGAAAATNAVLRRMLLAGRGTIVNLSSGAASRPTEGWTAYCASKAALAMFTQTVALEYGASGIRAFSFAPGVVDTEMQGQIRASGLGPIARIPREKLADPSQPAKAIAFLCSAASSGFLGRELDVRDPALRAAAGLPAIA